MHLPGEKVDPSRVSARPGEALDKTELDRVGAAAEHDWDVAVAACRFHPKSNEFAASGNNHGHSTADHVCHHRRKAVISALQPVILDRYVPALNVAGFAQALAERSHT